MGMPAPKTLGAAVAGTSSPPAFFTNNNWGTGCPRYTMNLTLHGLRRDLRRHAPALALLALLVALFIWARIWLRTHPDLFIGDRELWLSFAAPPGTSAGGRITKASAAAAVRWDSALPKRRANSPILTHGKTGLWTSTPSRSPARWRCRSYFSSRRRETYTVTVRHHAKCSQPPSSAVRSILSAFNSPMHVSGVRGNAARHCFITVRARRGGSVKRSS